MLEMWKSRIHGLLSLHGRVETWSKGLGKAGCFGISLELMSMTGGGSQRTGRVQRSPGMLRPWGNLLFRSISCHGALGSSQSPKESTIRSFPTVVFTELPGEIPG